MIKKPLCFLLLFLVSLSVLPAQTSSSDPNMVSTQFDMTGFPQWSKDLRRGTIVAFGAFPFMYFFSSFGVDTYRFITDGNGNDFRYAPWPLDGLSAGGPIGKSDEQKLLTIGIAAGSSILIALIDYGIERHKRTVKKRETINYPEGTPIIIRKPLNEEEADDYETGIP